MLDITKIPLNDPKTWEMISEGKTKGCFQIESQLGKTWCKKVKPSNISELSDLISLIRPGCISKDVLISVRKVNVKKTRRSNRFKRISIEELYNNRSKYTHISSYDESKGCFVDNKILDVMYTGEKECFKIKIRKYSMGRRKSRKVSTDWYDLECTNCHELLTNHGWVELQNLKIGDRIAVVKRVRTPRNIKKYAASRHSPLLITNNIQSLKYFSEVCYKYYEEKCVICDYSKTTLDTHHIEGNRFTDNSPQNLCFLCPNHHREYEQGLISKDLLLERRDFYKLPVNDSIEWVTYMGKESVGVKSVYDISMDHPHHNFIAGNVVVHNCLKFIYNGKSMAQHYADRKSGVDKPIPIHVALTDILKDTYQVILYQEQIIRISQEIAGYSESEADILRKSVGKKDAALLHSLEESFVNGCVRVGKVSKEDAELIFSNISKSARYLFNKSHGISYAYIAYWSAYLKAHKPLEFYLNWLKQADDKIDPDKEMKELIMSAKADGIKVYGPSLTLLNENFALNGNAIHFGFCNVKNVGQAEFKKIQKRFTGLNIESWDELMIDHLLDFNKRTIDNLIYVGAFSGFGKTRLSMIHEIACLRDLSDSETEWLKNNGKDLNLVARLNSMARPKKEGGGASNKNRIVAIQNIVHRLENAGRSLWDNPSTLAKIERDLLGCEISFSELENCRDASFANSTCLDFTNRNHPKRAIIACTISSYREIETKNKEKMCFLTVEDESGELENIVVFPNIYSEYMDIIYNGSTILLTGVRSNKNDDSFMVEEINQI